MTENKTKISGLLLTFAEKYVTVWYAKSLSSLETHSNAQHVKIFNIGNSLFIFCNYFVTIIVTLFHQFVFDCLIIKIKERTFYSRYPLIT